MKNLRKKYIKRLDRREDSVRPITQKQSKEDKERRLLELEQKYEEAKKMGLW